MDKLVHWRGIINYVLCAFILHPSLLFDLHNQPLEYAPWADARPYDGGFRYNCMMLQVLIALPL